MHLNEHIRANGHVGSDSSRYRDAYIDHYLHIPEDMSFNESHDGVDMPGRTAPPSPVAICGFGMRLPGGIRDSTSFWDLLVNGKDSRSEIPASRYNSKGFDEALGKKGAIKTQYGYFLDEDLSTLDTSFFSLTKNELEKTDPQQRQILEVTRECLESAGEVDYRGKMVGCYVGTFGEDWLQMSAKESQHSGGYIMTGHGDLMIANRVSYEYDFRGPSMVIKTGCSASLVGLHEACRALQNGDCSAAIVAGTNLIMGPTTTAAMTAEGILSPEGSCKTFDESADGFARGEAITAVYVKTLDDAIRDGNPIRAVIRNTSSNSDGKSTSLMAPSSESHEMLMRKVYKDCGLDPRDTPFVECHGTGTPTGDPIETTAVGNVFGERGVYIGSVKPNLGHSEGASGISSLIKGVLSLENETIPPNIKFNRPNPKIPFSEKKLKVPVKATLWPEGTAKRVSINSFGIGGSNAHVILDSPAEYLPSVSRYRRMSRQESPVSGQLLVYSANSQESLRRLMEDYHKYNQVHPERIPDVAYTLAAHREHLPYRAFAVAGTSSEHQVSSLVKKPAAIPKVVMVFSGQGAQWPKMGAELLTSNKQFLMDIRAMDKILQTMIHPPSWKIEDELSQNRDESRFGSAEFAQPLSTAVQIALVNAVRRAGIRPDVVVGHSSGEISAAYASGALSLPAALIVAYHRGLITKSQTAAGGMAAVGLGRDAVDPFLVPGVVVACENSPCSSTISGDLDKLDEVIAAIKEAKPDVLARKLKVNQPYHSHHMKAIGAQYVRLLSEEFYKRQVIPLDPKVKFISTVTAKQIKRGDELGPQYWQSNLVCPVLFSPAVEQILQENGEHLLLEIGPHSTLAGPLRQICAESKTDYNYIPTMLRNKDCVQSLLSAFGQLHQQGMSLDFSRIIGQGTVLTDLPRYPWDHNASYWYENRISKDWRFRRYGHHSLLGLRITEGTGLEPSWRNVLYLEDEPWLADHKIREDVIFPFAGYCAMAGEAVRQATGIESGFSLRHAIAKTAMVLNDTDPVEVVTTLRPHALTDSSSSDWWDFVISSFSGGSWIKNCEGQVKAIERDRPQFSSPEPLLREVKSSRWYEAMADIGIVYGRTFQGLSSITSSAVDHTATGVISTLKEQEEAAFLFHPSAIDACLQLLLVALAKGIRRNFAKLYMPTVIEELDVFRSASEMQARAWSSPDRKTVGIECGANGETALRLTGLKLTPLDDEETVMDTDPHAAARLEWRPHFDFMDHNTLFTPPKSDSEETRLQEEMTLLCMIDSAEQIANLETKQWHFEKFRDWLQKEIGRAKDGTYPVLGDCSALLALDRAARVEAIKNCYEQLTKKSNKDAVAVGIWRIWENMADIFTGNADTLDILMRDDMLTQIYNVVSFGHSGFIQMLSHAKPTMKILEVGAGTGGTTQTFLHDLIDSEGSPSYSLYTFTDISAGFFPQAKERFSYAPNMDYKVFDISKNPFDQGFEPESYDLILAPNVVHATQSLKETLSNLQPLLKPNGHLVLTELSAVVRTPNYIFGNFSGWWLGDEDGRSDEPYVSVSRWDEELKASGFCGVTTAVYDAEEPYQYCAVIVSQPERSKAVSETGKPITLLTNQPQAEIARAVISKLENLGRSISVAKLGESIPQDQDVISLLDVETNLLESITVEEFTALQEVLRNQGLQNLLFVTKPAQVNCQSPQSAASIGFARTIRSELASKFFTLEIAPEEPTVAEVISQVFDKVQCSQDIEDLLPDREFIFDDGFVKVGRYHPYSLQQELARPTMTSQTTVKTLEIGKPGLLETLGWVEGPSAISIGETDVEIETHSVGLNFRDVVFAMGVISSGSDRVPLGLETSGIVKRVGSNVKHLAVGDRVMALAPDGCIATDVVLPGSLVVQIPEDLSFDDAASMPLCYITVLQSLIVVGQVEEGQSVLIHSAAGGIGHAAINVCQMLGAEIYVTVGNDQKRQYLQETFGIPESRIFDSRSDSFVGDIMSATGGKGVDLVLNSLSGELLHASWRCVRDFGKLVELGKRDLAGHGKLDMETFLANRSYCCVDAAQLIRERPQAMGRLLGKLLEGYSKGQLHPIKLGAQTPAVDALQAFRSLQKGDLIGKAIIKMPSSASEIEAATLPRSLQLDPEASYLVTGGLGGLGKPLARWMVERGARSLVFLSRSAGAASDDQRFFAELESMGCAVASVAGKAQDTADIDRAISSAPRPIKGVVHFAMVLRDAPMVEMKHEDWVAAIEPKVHGAWNLHHAFADKPLDFFLLASSLVTIVDQPGQGNYNASNTFLEAFTQYRRSQDLPASVLNICPIEGVGFVAENSYARKNLKAQGLYFLRESHLFDFVELAMLNSAPTPRQTEATERSEWSPWSSDGQFIMGLRSAQPLSDPDSRTNWRRDRRMGIYHNLSSGSASDSAGSGDKGGALAAFLSSCADEPEKLGQPSSAEFLAVEIGRKVFAFMLRPVEDDSEVRAVLDHTLAQIGLDSLMAIELRRWCKVALGLEMSVLEIMAAGTLEHLGQVAAEGVLKKLTDAAK